MSICLRLHFPAAVYRQAFLVLPHRFVILDFQAGISTVAFQNMNVCRRTAFLLLFSSDQNTSARNSFDSCTFHLPFSQMIFRTGHTECRYYHDIHILPYPFQGMNTTRNGPVYLFTECGSTSGNENELPRAEYDLSPYKRAGSFEPAQSFLSCECLLHHKPHTSPKAVVTCAAVCSRQRFSHKGFCCIVATIIIALFSVFCRAFESPAPCCCTASARRPGTRKDRCRNRRWTGVPCPVRSGRSM